MFTSTAHYVGVKINWDPVWYIDVGCQIFKAVRGHSDTGQWKD